MTAEQRHSLIGYLRQFVTERRRERMATVLDRRTRYLTVVLEDVFQPHNASAVLRTCEIFGVQDVHVIEKGYEFRPNRDIVIGATQWLTLHRYRQKDRQGTRACLDGLRAQGYRIAATTLHPESMLVADLDLSRPVALCFGTEEEGLTETAHELADVFVQLPMFGFTQSFNVSVSAALFLSNLVQRLHASDVDWQLEAAERQALELQWLMQSLEGSDLLVQRYLDGGMAPGDADPDRLP